MASDWVYVFLRRLFWPLFANMTVVIYKPKVYNVSKHRERRTEPRLQNIWHKTFGENPTAVFWDIRADKKIHSLQYSAPVCQKVQLQNTCNICSYYLRISAHRLQRISESVDVCVSYKQPKSAHFWDSVWSQCSENVNALFVVYRVRLPVSMPKNDIGVWSILKQCVGKVNSEWIFHWHRALHPAVQNCVNLRTSSISTVRLTCLLSGWL